MSDAPVTHEEAHDALVCVNSYPESTAKLASARIVQRYIKQEEEQAAKLARYEGAAKDLWALLDDIDTLGDSMKPERTPYFEAISRIVEKRHEILTTNGYELFLVEAAEEKKT